MKKPSEPFKAYGGIHTGSWVDRLPASWIPYVQLCRLSPPAPIFLIYFPHLFGIIYASILSKASGYKFALMCLHLLGGCFFFSNAAHSWNDLIDVPIDKMIERTRNRPIVRGAITPRAAFVFMLSQAFLAASFLVVLPPATALYTIPTIIATTYYPWAKRQTPFPQLVLGLWLAWGVTVAMAAMGVDPLETVGGPCLVAVCILWAVIYDTVYACLDRQDDVRLSLGSAALLFGNRVKLVLSMLLICMLAFLGTVGYKNALGVTYSIISVGGCAISLGLMITFVDLQSTLSVWWWFTYGFWFAGGTIGAGLLWSYVNL